MVYDDPRIAMGRFPNYMQPFLTWLTGKPLPDDPSIINYPKKSLVNSLIICTAVMFFSMIAIVFSVRQDISISWLIIITSWVFIVNSSRTIQAVYCHHFAHDVMEGSNYSNIQKRIRFAVSELLTTLLVLPSFKIYSEEHYTHHHGEGKTEVRKDKSVPTDPDLKFLYELGFHVGQPESMLWKKLINTLFSPRFHFLFLFKRLKGNLISVSPMRFFLTIIYWAILFSAIQKNGALEEFIMVFVIPVIFLYQISALLQFVSEHSWVYEGNSQSARLFTFGRFCGEMPPERNSSLLSWINWWFRLVLIHLPTRTLILVGDLPQHDWHHAKPKVELNEWLNSIYSRQSFINDTDVSLQEEWGLLSSVSRVFREMGNVQSQP